MAEYIGLCNGRLGFDFDLGQNNDFKLVLTASLLILSKLKG